MATPDRTIDPIQPLHGRILVVEARFYDGINDALIEGARHAIEATGATMELVRVPGALEIPPAIAILLDASRRHGRPYDGLWPWAASFAVKPPIMRLSPGKARAR